LVKKIKSLLKVTRDIALVSLGVLHFALSGRNRQASYQALIRLFCLTKGWSNDLLSKILTIGSAAKQPFVGAYPGVAGDLSKADVNAITEKLDKEGFYVFEKRLSPELCEHLMALALSLPGSTRVMDNGAPADQQLIYNRSRPAGVRFEYDAQVLLEQAAIQALLGDPSLIAVAASYLRAEPILDIVTMWWHTAFSNGPDKEAAQFYHFDLDRLKWLKFFFYLTDVGPENGPHSFVARSHRTRGIPESILAKGYDRSTDEEVEKEYPREAFQEFIGPRGLILAEDTRGLHKGKHVKEGDRLVLQLEFTNSLFGAPYKPFRFPTHQTKAFTDAAARNRRLFKAFSR
jgi:hypothetical protein